MTTDKTQPVSRDEQIEGAYLAFKKSKPYEGRGLTTWIAAIQWADANKDDHEFKNFHRLLCERFDYHHDERDWKRDQLSLIEFIANPPEQVKPEGKHVAREWVLTDGLISWSNGRVLVREVLPDTVTASREDIEKMKALLLRCGCDLVGFCPTCELMDMLRAIERKSK